MVLLFSVVGVLLAGLILAALLGKVPVPGVPAPVDTASAAGLPDGALSAEDLDEVRFDAAVRGYRMDQVDAALRRVSKELRWSREEIDRLRAERAAGPQQAGSEPGAERWAGDGHL